MGDVNLGLAIGLGVAAVVIVVALILILCYFLKWRHKGSLNRENKPPKEKNVKTKKHNKSNILIRQPSSVGAEIYVVRHPFEGSGEDLLTLHPGRFVEVLEKKDDGWWRGIVEDARGWFPSSHVRPLSSMDPKMETGILQIELPTVVETEEGHSNEGHENEAYIPDKEEVTVANVNLVNLRPKSDIDIANESETLMIHQCRLSHASNISILPPPSGYSADTVSNRSSLPDLTNPVIDKNENYKNTNNQGKYVSGDCLKSSLSNQIINSDKFESDTEKKTEAIDVKHGENLDENCEVNRRTDENSKTDEKQENSKTDEISKSPAYGHFVVSKDIHKDVSDGFYEEISDFVTQDSKSPRSPLYIKTDLEEKKYSGALPKAIGLCTALYTFNASGRGQLSICADEVIEKLEEDENGWVKGRNKHGHVGYVPSSYIRQSRSEEVKLNSSVLSSSDDTLMFTDDFDSDNCNDITGTEYKAIYTFTAQQEGDLDFEQGDVVVVVEQLDNGWCKGMHGSKVGWFPSSYVEPLVQTSMNGVVQSLSPFQTEGPVAASSPRYSRDMVSQLKPGENAASDSQNSSQVTAIYATPKSIKLRNHRNDALADKTLSPTRPAPNPPSKTTADTSNNAIKQKPVLSKRISLQRPSAPPPPPPMQDMEYKRNDIDSLNSSWVEVASHHSAKSVNSISEFQQNIDNMYDSIVDEMDLSLGDSMEKEMNVDKEAVAMVTDVSTVAVETHVDTSKFTDFTTELKDIGDNGYSSCASESKSMETKSQRTLNVSDSSVDSNAAVNVNDSHKPSIPPKPPRTKLNSRSKSDDFHSNPSTVSLTTSSCEEIRHEQAPGVLNLLSEPKKHKPPVPPKNFRSKSLGETPPGNHTISEPGNGQDFSLSCGAYLEKTVDPIEALNHVWSSNKRFNYSSEESLSSEAKKLSFKNGQTKLTGAPSQLMSETPEQISMTRSYRQDHSATSDVGITPKAILNYRKMNLSDLRISTIEVDTPVSSNYSVENNLPRSPISVTPIHQPRNKVLEDDNVMTRHINGDTRDRALENNKENYGLVIQAKDLGHTPQVMLQYKGRSLSSTKSSSLNSTPPLSPLHTQAERQHVFTERLHAGNSMEDFKMRRARLLQNPHKTVSSDDEGMLNYLNKGAVFRDGETTQHINGRPHMSGYNTSDYNPSYQNRITNDSHYSVINHHKPLSPHLISDSESRKNHLRFFSPPGYVRRTSQESVQSEDLSPRHRPEVHHPSAFRPVHSLGSYSLPVSPTFADLAAPRPYRPLTFVSADSISSYDQPQASYNLNMSADLETIEYDLPLDEEYEGEESVV